MAGDAQVGAAAAGASARAPVDETTMVPIPDGAGKPRRSCGAHERWVDAGRSRRAVRGMRGGGRSECRRPPPRGCGPAGVERTTCAGANGRRTRKPDPQPHFGNAGSASLRRAGLAPDAYPCMPIRFPQTGCVRIVRAIRFRFAPSHRPLSHR
ncbi:Exonuclease SbcC [Burkholderia vietnamiensis]|nr:Exonuclease SbcC [Burkholderia vietnamiensis]